MQKDALIEGMHFRSWSSEACVRVARRMRMSWAFMAVAEST